MITSYRIEDITDYEDFLNKLFIGLEHYRKRTPHMKFKLRYDGTVIELTTMIQHADSLN